MNAQSGKGSTNVWTDAWPLQFGHIQRAPKFGLVLTEVVIEDMET